MTTRIGIFNRQGKRVVNWYAKKLRIGSYAMGCRGHPGMVVATNYTRRDPYGADLEIQSSLDGVIESCSVLNCSPDPLSEKAYNQYLSYYKTHGKELFTMWFHEAGYDKYKHDWKNLKEGDYGFGETLQEYMNMSDDEYNRYINRDWPENDVRPLEFDAE